MKSGKAPRARDSRLRRVTARDRGARRPPGEEERSLGRGTTGEPCRWGRSQAKWPGLADDPAHRSPF